MVSVRRPSVSPFLDNDDDDDEEEEEEEELACPILILLTLGHTNSHDSGFRHGKIQINDEESDLDQSFEANASSLGDERLLRI